MGIVENASGHLASFWAKRRLEWSGLSDMLKARPSSAIPPQPYDLWNLYSLVRQRQPRVVVEFGVGCSSFVLAEAVARNGQGHVYTIDANEHWLDVTRKDFPGRLSRQITFVHSPLQAFDYEGELCSRYTRMPYVTPDFMYLDGPAPSDVPEWPQGKAVCAADPVLLEPRFGPEFCMVVDGRTENVAFLERHLKRRYRLQRNPRFKLTTFFSASP